MHQVPARISRKGARLQSLGCQWEKVWGVWGGWVDIGGLGTRMYKSVGMYLVLLFWIE